MERLADFETSSGSEESFVDFPPYDDDIALRRSRMFSESLGAYKYKYCSQASSKSSCSDDSVSLSEWIEISKNLLSDDESCESKTKEEIFSQKPSPNVKIEEPEKLSSAPSSATTKIARKKSFECLICGKYLKKNLRYHIESVHYKIKKWYCNFCYYPFYYKHDLKRHLFSHINNPNFIPRKKFPQQNSTKNNSLICSWMPYKPNVRHKFVCNFSSCVKRFATSSQLKKHLNITHSDSRPHQCWCLKSFKSKSSLIRHRNEKHIHAKFFKK